MAPVFGYAAEVPPHLSRTSSPGSTSCLNDPALEERLRRRFGLESFRPWQREAIDALLLGTGRVLVVAPTGGGKSLCYQFPATELSGTTIVVSPLIALMEDQVRALDARGIRATWLSSTLDTAERRNREQKLSKGYYKLVYVAPERLGRADIVERLEALEPPLIAIDEAHCISHWGHDFRPDYLRLSAFLDRLAPARVLACTATATPMVRDEILTSLRMPQEKTTVVLRGFARPNLHLAVHEVTRSRERVQYLQAALHDALGSAEGSRGGAIVYAATRKETEKTAQRLQFSGWRVAAYHAGMDAEARANVNRTFAEGELDVVVATNAFGMGIDRADIRLVVHIQAPGSIEAYYQEVGRAGRDGQPAHGMLITTPGDLGLRRRLIDLRKREAGETPEATQQADRQWKLFVDLLRYAEAGSCRHDFILRYFGDEQETLGGCGHCDVCEAFEEQEEGLGSAAISESDVLVVRKALSGIARSRGRAGLTSVAEMLDGADSPKLRRTGLTALSTHGLLSGYGKDWIVALLRRLIAAGLVDLSGDEFPMPFLTPAGARVMKGVEPARVLLPRRQSTREKTQGLGDRKGRQAGTKKRPIDTQLDPRGQALFEALRQERRAVAQSLGVPAYVVCHDRTLVQIALRRPSNTEQLAEISGMGPARIASYGEHWLRVVAEAGPGHYGPDGPRTQTVSS